MAHSTNGNTLPATRLENTFEYLAGIDIPAGYVMAHVVVTTVSGGIEYRPVHKYGTRDKIDLANYPAARLFIRRATAKKTTWDELDRTATDAAGALDYVTGFLRLPAILLADRTGAFPGFVKTVGGLIPRAQWEADRTARMAATGVIIPPPLPSDIVNPPPPPTATETAPTVEPETAPTAPETFYVRPGGAKGRYFVVTDKTAADLPRYRKIESDNGPNVYELVVG